MNSGPPTQDAFQQNLARLNPEQYTAATHLYGPMLVLAGPGTGKTQVLTTRIANLLQAGVGADPQNILCLTFTESGAVAMKNRLVKWIGPEAYRVKISTFHGFCQSVLEEHSTIFSEQLQNKTIADDLSKVLVFQKTIQSQKWKYLKPLWDEFTYRIDILMAISSLKREHITPAIFRDMIPDEKERLLADPKNFYKRKYKEFSAGDFKPEAAKKIEEKIEKMHEFSVFWEKFQANLEAEGFYDFDDQINWVVNALKTNETLKFDLQEQYQWILVDEYQDTNGSQNDILWELCDGIDDPNIFVVGDDDQSIYRFQGASIANITDFEKKFSNSTRVTLNMNYRSTQKVLDAAYQTVNNNIERVDPNKSLTSAISNLEIPAVSYHTFASPHTEINFIVQTINNAQKKGIPATEISILVRKNREIETLARELPRFGISVSAQINQDIFENSSVQTLILMLKIFSGKENDEDLIKLLHAPHLKISSRELFELSHQIRKERKSILEFLHQRFSLGADDDSALADFYRYFIESRKDFYHLRPTIISEKMFYESGLSEFLVLEKNYLDFHNIRTFLDWIRDQNVTECDQLFEKIDLHQSLQIPLRPTPLPGDTDSIQIMTAHKSKGLEFEVVLIPGFQDKKWGNNRNSSKIPLPQLNSPLSKGEPEGLDKTNHDLEEERRLFFVALTRAKSEVFLSHSENDMSGRAKNPSQFLHEIPENLITKKEDEIHAVEAHELLPSHHSAPKSPKTDEALLKDLVQNFVWSASSLQGYLDCPRRFLFQNLYKFPRRTQPPMAHGVALHQALERYYKVFNASSNEVLPDFSLLETEFTHALRGQNLEKNVFEDINEHGLEILKAYFKQKILPEIESNNKPKNDLLEFNFHQFSPHIEGIPITGKADKIEFIDAEQKQARIIDYKSGKPKTIKVGENYWRQLVFYDLLTRASKGISWESVEGVIEFLTPDPKSGKIVTRSYTVTEEDRLTVSEELRTADQAVKNLEFPAIANPKEDREIEYWNNFGK